MFIPKVLKNSWKKNFLRIFWDLKNYVLWFSSFWVHNCVEKKKCEKL